MTDDIRFSIVIPAYNSASTIIASVESCLGQSVPAHELIVVDDASTDGTADLLEARFGLAIRVISLPRNSGPSAARNIGMEAATGTHIAFQDADDFWHHEKLEHMSEVLKRHPHIHFLFHPYTLAPVDFKVNAGMLQASRYPMWKLLLSNPIGTPCVVIQRSAVLPFNEGLRHMEDYELFLRIAHKYDVYRIAAPFTQLGRPILSAGGQSSSRWNMRIGEIRAWWSLATKHIIYLPSIPVLVAFALLKHVVKSAFPPRRNY